ncbi:hypothetical protein N7540_011027 [Penicillium herquei]|nr:hypothetical protein N7540_011027 [Penicillium herquei]
MNSNQYAANSTGLPFLPSWSMYHYATEFVPPIDPAVVPEPWALHDQSPEKEECQEPNQSLPSFVQQPPQKRTYRELRPRPVGAAVSQPIESIPSSGQEKKRRGGVKQKSRQPCPRAPRKAGSATGKSAQRRRRLDTSKTMTSSSPSRVRGARLSRQFPPQEGGAHLQLPDSEVAPCMSNKEDRRDPSRFRSENNVDNPQQPQDSAGVLERSLRGQFLVALQALLKVLNSLQDFKAEAHIINAWVTEIKGLDMRSIPAEFPSLWQINKSLARLNQILESCLTAPDSTGGPVVRNQAFQLLEYVQDFGTMYCFPQLPYLYLQIGQWLERLEQARCVAGMLA